MAETTTPDAADVLESAKIQYGGDKVFYMTRRMSGMPLLHRLDKSYVMLEPQFKDKLNDLLDKFPDPPSTSQFVGTGNPHINVQKSGGGGGWGSIRGLAEKFNVFNKSS